MTRHRFVRIPLAVGSLSLAAACGGGGGFANASVRMGENVVATASDGTFALVPPPRLTAGAPVFVLANGCAPVALSDPRPADGRAPLPLAVQRHPDFRFTALANAGGRLAAGTSCSVPLG